MIRHCLLIAIAAVGLAGCQRNAKPEDVLATTSGASAVARELRCTEGNADGVRCDRKTCKKDTRSDCLQFSEACTNSGHKYEGNDDAGACVRTDQTG